MTAREIATRIDTYLKRFEQDPEINKPKDHEGVTSYYGAGAWASSTGWVGVRYISYQGYTSLRRADAEKYLAWLQAGNVGTHYKAGLTGRHHS